MGNPNLQYVLVHEGKVVSRYASWSRALAGQRKVDGSQLHELGTWDRVPDIGEQWRPRVQAPG